MVDRLLTEGYEVKVIDNFRSGKMRFIEHNLKNPKFSYDTLDCKNAEALISSFVGHDIVFHFAANADVKGNVLDPLRCLHENVIVTQNVLEAMRHNGIKKIVFSSTCSVYGEPTVFPTPEDAPFPIQTSMYAASKVYGEGIIEAYCAAYDMQCWIYRFVSIMGERYTHGVVFSFYKELLKQEGTHKTLTFLSDGTPTKSYMYVQDCIEGIMQGLQQASERVNLFNLGTDEEISAKAIGEIMVEELGLDDVQFIYGNTERGWIGDAPHIRPDISRLRALGWEPKLSIPDTIRKTVRYLKENPWALHENYFRE
jgi:UDP-glucose 4-epimerase